MRRLVQVFLLSSLASILCIGTSSYAQVKTLNRIGPVIDNTQLSRLPGNLHPLVRPDLDLGPVSGTMMLERMKMVFAPTPAQKAELDALLQAQQDRKSPLYHRWLTPQQYADRFGLSPGDFDTISQWLQQQGFTIAESPASRTWIAFSGSADRVTSAFHTEIHGYAVGAKLHYANASEPSIPSALAGVVSAIASLNDFAPQAKFIQADPRLTSSSTGDHFLLPNDFATIYDFQSLYSQGIDGSGQSIAVVGQSNLSVDANPGRNSQYDVSTFRSLANLQSASLQTILVPGSTDPGIVSGDVMEANLDLEWSGGIAPGSRLFYVFANSKSGGAFDALMYTIDQNLAGVVSVSYGVCEPQVDAATLQALTTAGQQANAQGQTIVTASGDSGAADCDSGTVATHGFAVDVPSALPYVTSTGGTEFSNDTSLGDSDPTEPTRFWDGSTDDLTASAFSYLQIEVGWDDSNAVGGLAASGGGVSKKFTKPAWQNGLGVPADSQRDVPDISFTSSPIHDSYLICSESSCVQGFRQADQSFLAVGGTSAAAPCFAGIVALLNQRFGQLQGNINPALYTQANSYTWVFHDITVGDNYVPCQAGSPDCSTWPGYFGYAAGTGYDLVTGLGSVDVAALVNAINGTPQPDFWIISDRTIKLTSGNSGEVMFTVLPLQGFTGSVDGTCSISDSLPGLTCQVAGPSLLMGQSTFLIVTSPDPNAARGTYKGIVTLSLSNGSFTHQVPVHVTVTYPDFYISSPTSPLNMGSGATATDVLSISSDRFQGDVQLVCMPSPSLGASTCSLNPPDLTVNYGAATSSTLTVVAAANTSSNPLSGTITVQGTSGTTVSSLALPLTIASGDFQISSSTQSLSLGSGGTGDTTITISAASGFSSVVALSCNVSAGLGATSCSLSPASLSGTGSATLTIHGATLAGKLDKRFPLSPRGIGLESSLLFAAALLIPAKRRSPRRKNRGLWIRLLGLLAISLLTLTASCGGGSSSSGSGGQSRFLNGTVTVQAASGSLNHTVQITVSVD
jgi:hypothetical protein